MLFLALLDKIHVHDVPPLPFSLLFLFAPAKSSWRRQFGSGRTCGSPTSNHHLPITTLGHLFIIGPVVSVSFQYFYANNYITQCISKSFAFRNSCLCPPCDRASILPFLECGRGHSSFAGIPESHPCHRLPDSAKRRHVTLKEMKRDRPALRNPGI